MIEFLKNETWRVLETCSLCSLFSSFKNLVCHIKRSFGDQVKRFKDRNYLVWNYVNYTAFLVPLKGPPRTSLTAAVFHNLSSVPQTIFGCNTTVQDSPVAASLFLFTCHAAALKHRSLSTEFATLTHWHNLFILFTKPPKLVAFIILCRGEFYSHLVKGTLRRVGQDKRTSRKEWILGWRK